MPPDAPRRPKKIFSLCLKHFLGVRQISHSFLTSKLDRSDISRNIPNFLHSLIISGMKCCTHNSNLRHSDLTYKHHTLVIDYLDVRINHLFFATSGSDKLVWNLALQVTRLRFPE